MLIGAGALASLCSSTLAQAGCNEALARHSVCAEANVFANNLIASRLEGALLDTVKRGTASHISNESAETGWSIGGKTGTGGVPGAPMSEQNGWFAGLIFDRNRKARFTVATFVEHGGSGGGSAAEISAKIARFLKPESIA